jgi:hypothetical protein
LTIWHIDLTSEHTAFNLSLWFCSILGGYQIEKQRISFLLKIQFTLYNLNTDCMLWVFIRYKCY